MRPVVTVAEMGEADRAAIARVGEDVLVRRAGTAVAAAARRLLGPPYGRRVVVVAGKGNNGADGRVAADLLRRRGARVTVADAAGRGGTPPIVPPCDLVVDAAYGTGFAGDYAAPAVPPGVPVLAVDICSGVAGDTGAVPGTAVRADATVAMAALKPGHLQGEGAALAGAVTVADIGIEVPGARAHLVEDADLALVPPRATAAHKWSSAVAVVAGSPGMEGAAALCAGGASHAGAGMVRLCVPGSATRRGARPGPWPLEAVRLTLGAHGWAPDVAEVLGRCRCLVIGPGLGGDDDTADAVRQVVAGSPVPVVADADALGALAGHLPGLAGGRPLILTPHDGEYRRLAGEDPGPDRLAAARRLAAATGAVVLLKGSLTVVAAPDGRALLAAAGSPRLATAGTGDVLSGIIGAFVARGTPPFEAAALAAHAHGRAASLGPSQGLVAGDLGDLVARWLSAAVPA